MICIKFLLLVLFLYRIHCAIIRIPGNIAGNIPTSGSNPTLHSLQYYLCDNGSIDDNTVFEISSLSDHFIDSGPLCIVQNVYNLTLRSDSSLNISHIVCKNRAIGFFNITNLQMQNLQFEHCGGLIDSPETSQINNSRVFFSADQKSVLFLSWCVDVSITNVTIKDEYHGYAMIMVNIIGVINFRNAQVIGQSISSPSTGSGIMVLYTCTECDTNTTTLSFVKCKFENNTETANYRDNPIELLENGAERVPLFGSAGLTLLFIESSPSNTFIQQTFFTGNNGSITSGCLALFFSIKHSTLNIQKMSTFAKNSFSASRSKGSGLGIYILATKQGCVSVSINNTLFYNNSNYIGAGCYIRVTNYLHYTINIEIMNSLFYRNIATYKGSGLYIERDNLDSKSFSKISVLLEHVTLRSNGKIVGTSFFNPQRYLSRFSTIELVGLKYVLIKELQSLHDRHTPIVLVKTDLFIAKKAKFRNTRTESTFIMKEGSIITFLPNTQVTFDLSRYMPSGAGTITAYNNNYKECPIIFRNQSKILVTTTTYLQKYFLYISRLDMCNITDLMRHIVFIPKKRIDSLISSAPTGVCVCASDGSCVNSTTVISLYPGAINSVSLRAVCGPSSTVSCFTTVKLESLRLSFDSGTFHPELTMKSTYRRYLRNSCTVFQFQFVLKESNDITLHYQSNTRLFVFSYDQNDVVLVKEIATINIENCPIGFTLINSHDRSCICDPLLQNLVKISCNISSTSIVIPANSWLGEVYNATFNRTFGYSFVCPYQYCKNGVTEVNMTEADWLCDSNRTGVLCGHCIDGYSIVLGPDVCRVCDSNIWLLTILGFAVAGIILVAFLFYLQLTISIELFAAIIFYANITQVSLRSLVLSHDSNGGYVALDVLFSLLNTELGFEMCFYDGMTTTVKTALQFLFPAYLCILVVGIWLISKFSVKFASLTMDSSVQVLATLMYLSFSKLVLTVINILVPAYVYTPNDTITVWYADGNASYWSDIGHIALLMVALLISIFYIVPFLVWSTFASFLSKKSKWIKRRRNLVDVFHGQYRDTWTWWFGARLWLFLMCSITYTVFRGNNLSLLLTFNFSFLAPFLLAQVYFKPFKSEYVNKMDSVVLTNLLLVEIVTLYSIDNGITLASSLVVFLLVLSVALMLLLMITVRFINKFKRARDVLKEVKLKYVRIQQHPRYEIATCNSDSNDSDCCLREPLLETF